MKVIPIIYRLIVLWYVYFIFYNVLGHSPRGSVVYAGVDIATGEMVAVTEWTLKLKPKISKKVTFHDADTESNDFTKYMKQVIILKSVFLLGCYMI